MASSSLSKCLGINKNGSNCSFLKFNKTSDYCGIHKSKEHQEAMVEYRKNKSKNYYIDNKEMLTKKYKLYHEQNKARLMEKYTCECGAIICKMSYLRHTRSSSHSLRLSISNISNV